MQTQNQTSFQESESKGTQISLFKDCRAIDSTPISIEELFELIRSGHGFKDTIDNIRATNDQNEKDNLKKQLPAVTVSGLFENGRKKENLIAYSGLIQIDIDKVGNLSEQRDLLEKDKYTYALFISPSGNGLKLIVKISEDIKNHQNSFLALEKYYKEKYKLQIDKSCKDVTRLMFLSYDNSLFTNENANLFDLYHDHDLEIKIQEAIKTISSKQKFAEGNRNNFIFKLACDLFKKSIPIEITINELLKKYTQIDFGKEEIIRTIKSAYSNNSNTPNNSKNGSLNSPRIVRIEQYLESKYEIRFNVVSCKLEIRSKLIKEPFKELNENNIFCELSKNHLHTSMVMILSILRSDFVPQYDPIKNYFTNFEKWDAENEIDYIEKLCNYIKVKDPERFRIQFKKMLVRCIACSLDVNVFNKQAFILVHEEQGSGKTSLIRWLCPPELLMYYTEHFGTDKDGQHALASNFMINLDELALYKKQDLNTLKSFMSRLHIKLRLAYDRRDTWHSRRANFWGSTNSLDFLNDESGTQRSICFELIGRINFDYSRDINVNDIWRQAYQLYKDNFEYRMSIEELMENEIANRRFSIISSEQELIPKLYLPGSENDNDEFLTTTEIFIVLVSNNPEIPINRNEITKALRNLGFKRFKSYSRSKGQTVEGYFVKKIKK